MSNDTFTVYNEHDQAEATQFCRDFLRTTVGKKFLQLVGSANAQESWDEVIAKFRKVYGDDDITFGDIQSFVSDLLLAGAIRAPEPEPEPEKQLSKSQLQWAEFSEFANTHSMDECRARAQEDSSFASFIRLSLEREAANRDEQLINRNPNRTATTQFVSAELQTFTESYKTMPIAKVRLLSNAGTNPGGKAGADRFNTLLNKMFEQGLA